MASGLGPSCIHGRDIPNNDQNEIVPAREKFLKNSKLEADAGSSSNNCFVALVKTSNLQKDTLYLPQDLTRSNGLSRKCKKILITDGNERSWEMDLKFDKSGDTFYITRGWRYFCDESGKKAGSLFTFELVTIEEMPSLVFCPKDSIDDIAHLGDKDNQNRYVTVNLSNDSNKRNRLYLPLQFLKANGMEKLRMVTLIGNDGVRRIANVLCETSGRMSLGKGWKEFAISNKLVVGQSFTLEAVLTNGTHMLRLSASTKLCEEETKNDNNAEARSESSSRFLTLELRPEDVNAGLLYLPSQFLKASGISKLGKITLLGKDKMKWSGFLLEKDGLVALGSGWEAFCEDNGVMTGDSFSLQLVCEEEEEKTPIFKICPN